MKPWTDVSCHICDSSLFCDPLVWYVFDMWLLGKVFLSLHHKGKGVSHNMRYLYILLLCVQWKLKETSPSAAEKHLLQCQNPTKFDVSLTCDSLNNNVHQGFCLIVLSDGLYLQALSTFCILWQWKYCFPSQQFSFFMRGLLLHRRYKRQQRR